MKAEQIKKILLERKRVRVSLHAIGQFQKRLADLPDKDVRMIISRGVKASEKVRLFPDGGTISVRTRRPFPYEFRAILVYDEAFECPVVTTVLRGDSWKVRKHRTREKFPAAN